MKFSSGLRAPPALADAVEDDDGVVDRQTDDRHRGRQEDAVDRLLQPGEEADHEDHVVRHREHRGDAEGPLEADGEVEQLGQERDAEGDERVVAQLVAERGADASGRRSSRPCHRPRTSSSSIRCSSSLEISPVRTVKSAVSAVCTTASGKPASATASRACVDRDLLADRVVELAAAGELDAEVEALGDDAGDGDDERRRRDAQPRLAALHQLRVLAVQPGAHLADVGAGR